MQANKIKPLNAKEFFKKHGLQESKELLKKSQDASFGGAPFFKNLQRLVESWELIEFFGCLDDAIQIYEFSKGIQTISYGGRKIEVDQLKQAITDVESCQPDLPESVILSLGEVS